MLTPKILNKQFADIEKEFVDFMIEHFGGWKIWADASQRVADRQEVREDDLPPAFRTECKIMKAIVEMMHLGTFDWNNPKLSEMFKEMAESPFYQVFGKTLADISLRIAELAGVKTFIEIGAGKANLTSIMLERMKQSPVSLPVVTTDVHEVVLENISRLGAEYPGARLETHLWNVSEPPPESLKKTVQKPALIYERYTLNYANLSAVKNMAQVADILVLGDWFNFTGELFPYDEVFQKIGAMPLFYKDIKPILDECFPNQYIFDKRATDTINLPTVSLLICWK